MLTVLLTSFHLVLIAKWNAGIAPGEAWDTGSASPLLLKYIKEGKIPPGRALVPGCGRGYDVTVLADTDRYVMGLDISTVAVDTAKERLASLPENELHTITPGEGKDSAELLASIAGAKSKTGQDATECTKREGCLGNFSELNNFCRCKSNADFKMASFFDLDTSDPSQLFDFVYDYTFLCALHPTVRVEWAKKMAKLVKQDGELLTLIFPIRPPDEAGKADLEYSS